MPGKGKAVGKAAKAAVPKSAVGKGVATAAAAGGAVAVNNATKSGSPSGGVTQPSRTAPSGGGGVLDGLLGLITANPWVMVLVVVLVAGAVAVVASDD